MPEPIPRAHGGDGGDGGGVGDDFVMRCHRHMLVSGVVCCAFGREERRSLLLAAVVSSIFLAGVRGCFPPHEPVGWAQCLIWLCSIWFELTGTSSFLLFVNSYSR